MRKSIILFLISSLFCTPLLAQNQSKSIVPKLKKLLLLAQRNSNRLSRNEVRLVLGYLDSTGAMLKGTRAPRFGTLRCKSSHGEMLLFAGGEKLGDVFDNKSDCLRSMRNTNYGIVCARRMGGYRPLNIETEEEYGSSFSNQDNCITAVRGMRNSLLCSDDFRGYRLLDIRLNTGSRTFLNFDDCLNFIRY